MLWSRVAHLCSREQPFCPLCGNLTEFIKYINLWGKKCPFLTIQCGFTRVWQPKFPRTPFPRNTVRLIVGAQVGLPTHQLQIITRQVAAEGYVETWAFPLQSLQGRISQCCMQEQEAFPSLALLADAPGIQVPYKGSNLTWMWRKEEGRGLKKRKEKNQGNMTLMWERGEM